MKCLLAALILFATSKNLFASPDPSPQEKLNFIENAVSLSSSIAQEDKTRILARLNQIKASLEAGSHVPAPIKPKEISLSETETLNMSAAMIFTGTEHDSNPLPFFSLGIKEPSSHAVEGFDEFESPIVSQRLSDTVSPPDPHNPQNRFESHDHCLIKALPSGALSQRQDFLLVVNDFGNSIQIAQRRDSYIANGDAACGLVAVSTLTRRGVYEQWIRYQGSLGPLVAAEAGVSGLDGYLFHHDLGPGEVIQLASVTVGAAGSFALEGIGQDRQFSSPEDSSWENELSGKSTLRTIGQVGCALVANSNVLKFYGINTNPSLLNNWLKENNGYDSQNDLYFNRIPAYAKTQNIALSYSRKSNPAIAEIKQEIQAGHAPIIEVFSIDSKDKRHFLIVTGFKGNDLLIFDPGHAQPEHKRRPLVTLRDYFSTDLLKNDPKKQKILSLRLLLSLPGDNSSVKGIIRSPADLLLIDPQGRRTGIDPNGFAAVEEIPNAVYDPDASLGDDSGDGQDMPPYGRLEAEQISQGQYTLQIVGRNQGFYHLELYGTDQEANGNLQFQTFGVTEQSRITEFKINANSIPGQLVSLFKIVTFDTIREDINIARQLDLIKNQGMANSLLQKLDNAQKTRGNRQNPWAKIAAGNILEALINEIEAQKGKHIEQETANFLKIDIQELINSL